MTTPKQPNDSFTEHYGETITQQSLESLATENQNINDVHQKLETETQQLENNNQELDTEKKQLQSKNQQLQDENTSLKAEKGELEKKSQQLKNNNQELDTEKKQLQSRNQQLQDENTSLKAEKGKLEKKSQQLENNNQELDTEKKQLQSRNQQLQEENTSLKAKKDEFKTKSQQLESNNQKLNDENKEIQSRNQQLQEENKKFEDENYILKQDKERLLERKSTLEDIIQEIEDSTPKFFKFIPSNLTCLSNEIYQLKIDNKELRSKNDRLQTKTTELEEIRNELISVIARFSTSSEDITRPHSHRPQNHLLISPFRLLEEQDFHFLSLLIFRTRGEQHFHFTNKNQTIAKLKSVLSQEIFVKGMNIFEYDNAIDTVVSSVCAALKINSNDVSRELLDEIKKVSKKGMELVSQIALADPPGELWMEEEGTPFNTDKHQPVLGCSGSGEIVFTVYPGYRVGNRVFEKALVFTNVEFK